MDSPYRVRDARDEETLPKVMPNPPIPLSLLGNPNRPASEGSDDSDEKFPWWRNLCPWPLSLKWILAVTLLGIIFVLLVVLGATGVLGPKNRNSSAPPPAATPTIPITSTTTPSGTTSATTSGPRTSQPTNTAIPIQIATSCPDKSTWVSNVSLIAVSGAAAGGKPAFHSSKSAQECCDFCYENNEGCIAWMYHEDQFTPCTYVVSSNGDAADGPTTAQCPKGVAGAAAYTPGGNEVAGYGPCVERGFANSE